MIFFNVNRSLVSTLIAGAMFLTPLTAFSQDIPAPNTAASSTSSNSTVDLKYLQDWDAKCEQGNLDACNTLAQLHLENQLYPQAAKYLEKLCYSQSPNAAQSCAALTTLLTYENYQMMDLKKGQQVAEYLCNDQHVAFGCTALSRLFFRSENHDSEKAIQYAQLACDLQDASGCTQAAFVMYTEAYAEKDLDKATKAFEFYGRACELGDQDACKTYAPHEEKLEQFKNYMNTSN